MVHSKKNYEGGGCEKMDSWIFANSPSSWINLNGNKEYIRYDKQGGLKMQSAKTCDPLGRYRVAYTGGRVTIFRIKEKLEAIVSDMILSKYVDIIGVYWLHRPLTEVSSMIIVYHTINFYIF